MLPTTTIGIADDHALYLMSLKAVLQKDPAFEVTIEANNGKSYIENAWQLGFPHISILDVNMPGLNGFDTLKCINNMSRHSKIILMTGYSDFVTNQELARAGAHGIISKSADAAEFMATIKIVRDMPVTMQEDRVNKQKLKETESLVLNQKELQFAKLLSTGISYVEIAAQMHLSTHRIHDYRDRLFERFGVRTQAALIIKLIGSQVITANPLSFSQHQPTKLVQ